MRWYYKLPLRLRSIFRKNRAELDLSEELQFHLQNQIDEYVAQGMNPKEARHAALRSLGGIEQAKEECRDARKVNLIENFLQDVRFGLRMLRRSPGFSLLAILCLTLGIGANAAVFSWIEGILFRPYPAVAHQERLVAIGGTSRDEPRGTPLSWPDFQDLQRSCTLCETLFVSKITGTTLSIGDRAERTTGSIVSANYFDAIGVPPMLGRGFLPGEDQGQSAHPVVVISYQLWQGRFRGDPQIVGKTQRLNGVLHTIVGVAPEGFYGTFVGWGMNFWVPASMQDIFESGGYKLEDRGARWIEAYVRLKPGVTFAQAQQEFAAISGRLEAEYPATNRGRAIRFWPLWQTPFNNAGTLLPTLEIMLAVVAFVLLIACANVGNLLLVRSFARRHEMSVRLAVGAGRARLWRQLLTEGLVLSSVRSRRRPVGRVLVPPRAGAALPRARRRADALARRNRLARARAQRRRLPRHHAADGPRPRPANRQDRPRAVYENGIGRRGRRPRPRLGALGTGAGASLAQLRFAGRRRPADAEPAEGPHRQPRL